MKRVIDLGRFAWTLSGWTPYLWQLNTSMETGEQQQPEIPRIPVVLPCSVQSALLGRGLIPDPYTGLQARQCEWVENRHWCFECDFVMEYAGGHRYQLVLPGVDTAGWVLLDSETVGSFNGAHREHRLPLPPREAGTRQHHLRIIFDMPPRFAGQFGRTSQIPVTKPRFYYTWDWIPRLVQIGITRTPYLEDLDAPSFELRTVWTDWAAGSQSGTVFLQGNSPTSAHLALFEGETLLAGRTVTAAELSAGFRWENLPVKPWHPNLSGDQPLYRLTVSGAEAAARELAVGFKQVRWLPCEGAAADADPWICEVNGKPLFLQGVNWTPIRAFYADIPEAEYRKRLEIYRDMGCNILRIWGGGFLEPDFFYRMCDEMGLMVWQEFPMSSSGIENAPPADPDSIAEMERIADHYLKRLSGHVSLLAWSGGNELQHNVAGCAVPFTTAEPMLAMLERKVRQSDPVRRFMAASPSGPCAQGDERFYGTGKLWDVHGPWRWPGALADGWFSHWERDDSLFRSEFGCPGASDVELIRRHAGTEPVFPCSTDIPLWRYPSCWWTEPAAFEQEKNRPPETLEEYVQWSRNRQAEALSHAVKCMKSRFPRCGGAILWMGHDSFPCASNTSVIDFEGNPKPAAQALTLLFRETENHDTSRHKSQK